MASISLASARRHGVVRMAYGFVGAVTVRLTVGPALVVDVVLLEITPFESVPTMVNV